MPAPMIRTPFTDLFPAGYTHQTFGRCMKFEDNFLQCLEAYGQKFSEKKCVDYMEDLRECTTRTKQHTRVSIMQKERQKQIKSGEKPPGKEYMETPELHSFGGTFFGMQY